MASEHFVARRGRPWLAAMPSGAGYVNAVTAAVNSLVSERYMLASDAAGAIASAKAWFTQASGGMLP
jgi:hypothetical protein